MLLRKSVLQTQWVVTILLFTPQQGGAQSDCGAINRTRTITGPTSISTCTVLSGTISIASQATGSINLDGVEQINGSLIASFAKNISSLSSSTLQRISKSFSLRYLSGGTPALLKNLSFPLLTEVDDVGWQGLPEDVALNFSAGFSFVNTFDITRTNLSNLEGINLKNCNSLNIASNNRLRSIILPIETAKRDISISGNGPGLSVNLTRLLTVGDLNLEEVDYVYLPRLQTLEDILIRNTSLSGFDANSVTFIKNKLIATANPSITSISLLSLAEASSIEVTNNTLLRFLDFDSLSTSENITISGNLARVHMPSLKTVNQSFHLQSTNPSFDCSPFDDLYQNLNITGGYMCVPQSRFAKRRMLSGGTIAGIVVGSVAGFLAICIAIFFFNRRRRQNAVKPNSDEPKDETAADGAGVDGKPEIDGREMESKVPMELPTGQEGVAEELPAGNEAHELDNEDTNAPPLESFELSASPMERITGVRGHGG